MKFIFRIIFTVFAPVIAALVGVWAALHLVRMFFRCIWSGGYRKAMMLKLEGLKVAMQVIEDAAKVAVNKPD